MIDRTRRINWALLACLLCWLGALVLSCITMNKSVAFPFPRSAVKVNELNWPFFFEGGGGQM